MELKDLKAIINREYQLKTQQLGHVRLFFQPAAHFFHSNLEALARFSDDLSLQGEIPVCRMVRNREGTYTTNVNGTMSVLMAVPLEQKTERASIGTILSRFHRETEGLDVRFFEESPMDQRASEWISSMDDLDTHYQSILEKKSRSRFEQLFIENFPYFSGCAENAIQYLVDLSIDYSDREMAVFNHYRFSGESLFPENPALWVVDDRSRDLAEWLRVLAWTEGSEEGRSAAEQFLDDYEKEFPLTDSLIARMFARLLFPLSFAECCVRYFSGGGIEDGSRLLEETLKLNAEKSEDNEAMLAFLLKRYTGRIQEPEWLTDKIVK
ncbi:spore coat protein YutH [Sporolactobacillus sp. THM7-4]|nr:spore coat protein YutH [Sporolactobacillus sp. THM7-4]